MPYIKAILGRHAGQLLCEGRSAAARTAVRCCAAAEWLVVSSIEGLDGRIELVLCDDCFREALDQLRRKVNGTGSIGAAPRHEGSGNGSRQAVSRFGHLNVP
jgi:hypothetical protein